MAKKRHFGSIRRRPSGRWQARYTGPDGRLHAAPDTFARKAEAQRYLSLVEAQVARGDWIDTERAKVKLADYAERWIAERPNLRAPHGRAVPLAPALAHHAQDRRRAARPTRRCARP